MGRNRVVMLKAGYDAIRNSSETVAVLEAAAREVQARAQANIDGHTSERPFTGDQRGQDVTVEIVHNSSRAVAFVATNTIRGHYAEAADRALNRAIG